MLKTQLRLSKIFLSIEARTTSVSSKYPNLIEPFNEDQRQFFNHHVIAKSEIIRRSFQLQSQLRKCVTINQVNQIYRQNRAWILSSQKYATIIIEFLLEFYIDPNKNWQKYIQKDLQVYEFLAEYMKQTDQQGISGFSFHDMIQMMCLLKKIFMYYNEQQKHIKWKRMLAMVEIKVLDQLKKQQIAKNLGITDFHNILVATDYRQSQKLTILALNQLDKHIIFEQQNLNTQKLLLTIVRTLNQIEWKSWRHLKNIQRFLIQENRCGINYFMYPCPIFIYLAKLRLHLVGSKIIPPILKKILNQITANLSNFPAKILYQILSAFKLLPPNYEQKIFRKLFQYIRKRISHQVFFLLSIPYQRIQESQIKQIHQSFIKMHKQVLWSQGVFLFGYQQTQHIFGKGNNLTPITNSIRQIFQIKLNQVNYSSKDKLSIIAKLINFGNMLDQKRLTTTIQDGKKVYYGQLIAKKIIQILIKLKESIPTENLSKQQISSQKLGLHINFVNRLLTILSVKNIMSLLKIFLMIKYQKFDDKETKHQAILFLPKLLGLLGKNLDRRQSKIFFNNFQQQVISNFQQNGHISSPQIVSRISIYLVCHVIINKYQQKRKQQLIFLQQLNKKQEGLSSNSQGIKIQNCNKLYLSNVKYGQLQIKNLFQTIKKISQFDYKVYFKIIFVCLKSTSFSNHLLQKLKQILLQKLPRNQQILLIRQFIFLQERTKLMCKHMFQFLCLRDVSLKNMLTFVGYLEIDQLKSVNGEPITYLTQYFNKFVANKKIKFVLDNPMKDKNNNNYIDIKTINMALQRLKNFTRNQLIKKIITKLVLEYLKYFPLPETQSEQFDSTYNYEDAFNILRLSSQVLIFNQNFSQIQISSLSKIKQTNNEYQKKESGSFQTNQQKNSHSQSDGYNYSISGQKQEKKTSFSVVTHQLAQKILFISQKLMSSIQRIRDNISLDYQAETSKAFFHYLKHMIRQFQIQSNLSYVIPISIQQQKNLINYISVYNNTNFQSQFDKYDPLIVQQKFQYLNAQLAILKAYCCDRIRFQDNKTQINKSIRLIQIAVSKGDITQNHLIDAFSVFPESFVAQIGKIRYYSTLNNQKGQKDFIDCKIRFGSFFLHIIQKMVLNKTKTFQSSQYLIQILVGLNRITKQNYQSVHQKMIAYYNQMFNLQKNQNYQLKIIKFRYNQAIKNLIKKLPTKWSAHQVKEIIKYLNQSDIFDVQIVQRLRKQINQSSLILSDQPKEILYFLAKSNFLNKLQTSDSNRQVNLMAQITNQYRQIIQKQLKIADSHQKKAIQKSKKSIKQTDHKLSLKENERIVLQRYFNYIWGMIASNYFPLQQQLAGSLTLQLQALANLKNDQILQSLIIIFIRDIITKPRNIKSCINQENQKVQLFQMDRFELMSAKIYQFILIMIQCLGNLSPNNFSLYQHLNMDQKSQNFVLQLNIMFKMIKKQLKQSQKVKNQKYFSNILRLDAFRMRNNYFQKYLKQKGVKFDPCYAMKMPKKALNSVPIYDYLADYYLPEQRRVILMIRPEFLDYSAKILTGQFKVYVLIAKLYIFMINRHQSPGKKIELAIYDPRKFNNLQNMQSYQLKDVVQDYQAFLKYIIA